MIPLDLQFGYTPERAYELIVFGVIAVLVLAGLFVLWFLRRGTRFSFNKM